MSDINATRLPIYARPYLRLPYVDDNVNHTLTRGER